MALASAKGEGEGERWYSYDECNGRAKFRITSHEIANKLSTWKSPVGYLDLRFIRNDGWAVENGTLSGYQPRIYFFNPSKAEQLNLDICLKIDSSIIGEFLRVMEMISVHVSGNVPPVLRMVGKNVAEIQPMYRNLSVFSVIAETRLHNGGSVEVDERSTYPYIIRKPETLVIPSSVECMSKPIHMTEDEMNTWNEFIHELSVNYIEHEKFVRNVINNKSTREKRDLLIALLDDAVAETIPELTCSVIDCIRRTPVAKS